MLRKAVIDKYCRVPDGFAVGFDAEEDRRRFHVTQSGITLVTPEMLGQTVHQLR
jgi:glucose-1-phosphate adenylyltransferase